MPLSPAETSMYAAIGVVVAQSQVLEMVLATYGKLLQQRHVTTLEDVEKLTKTELEQFLSTWVKQSRRLGGKIDLLDLVTTVARRRNHMIHHSFRQGYPETDESRARLQSEATALAKDMVVACGLLVREIAAWMAALEDPAYAADARLVVQQLDEACVRNRAELAEKFGIEV